MDFFLCVIGMVMIVEGFPYLAFPAKMKAMLQKLLETPDNMLQKFGLILMLTGFCFVYFGKA